ALNVRFEDGRVKYAPAWRAVGASLTNTSPRFCYVANKADNTTSIFVGSKNGTVIAWTSTAEIAVSTAGYVPADAEAAWTGCTLAEVHYLNREDRVPWSIVPTATQFSNLTGWDSTWRCKVFRAYASALVALNITKAGAPPPTMIKTSDIVADTATVPTTWDAADPTNNATENIL